MANIDKRLDELYGLPLEEFTAARDRLAGELRESGDDAASEVKKLRRPTVSAWALNQLVRNHRKEVQELLKVGDDVRAALSGGGPEKMRDVSARRRRVIDRLTDRTGEQLAHAGHATSRTTLDKVGDTLMAATMDEDAADALRTGRLTRELSPPSGFEAALGGQIPAPSRTASKRDRQVEERVRRTETQVREAETVAREADREARRLEEQAERARRDAERARRRADRAEERAQELRRKAEERTA
jgi:hypothetical protein